MKLLVNIDQRATLAAGFPAPHSTEAIEFDPAAIPDPELRKFVADHYDFKTGAVRVYFKWDGTLPWRPDSGSTCSQEAPAILGPATLDKALAALEILHQAHTADAAHFAAVKARQAADHQAKEAELRAQFIAGTRPLRDEPKFNTDSVYPDCVFVQPNERITRTPDMEPAIAAYLQRRAAFEANQAQENEAQRQANAALLAQRQSTITRILTEHGTDAQRLRLERRLMANPEAEARVILNDLTFAAATLPRFQPLSEADVDMSNWPEDADLPEIEREYFPATKLNDAEMLAYVAVETALKAALPDAAVTPVFHGITRDSSDIPWTHRLAARAAVTRDGFELVRNFAVTPAE